MSEPKVRLLGQTMNEYGCDTTIYLKSEADAVIAEKDKRIDLYKRGWEESDRINASIYKEIRHQKYKRCLAMAERWLFAFYVTNKCNDKFYLRSLKYRELAEKFKEAK